MQQLRHKQSVPHVLNQKAGHLLALASLLGHSHLCAQGSSSCHLPVVGGGGTNSTRGERLPSPEGAQGEGRLSGDVAEAPTFLMLSSQ